MGMVYSTLSEADLFLSEESMERLAALENRPIDYSDIPPITPEQSKELRRLAVEIRRKKMFSLRLPVMTIEWWQSLGEGYTSIMVALLEEARRRPEWIMTAIFHQPFLASGDATENYLLKMLRVQDKLKDITPNCPGAKKRQTKQKPRKTTPGSTPKQCR
jgi:hypothetical protein